MTREEAIDKLEYLVEIGDFPRCEDALKWQSKHSSKSLIFGKSVHTMNLI